MGSSESDNADRLAFANYLAQTSLQPAANRDARRSAEIHSYPDRAIRESANRQYAVGWEPGLSRGGLELLERYTVEPEQTAIREVQESMMLRITVQDALTQLTLKLEGDLTGGWVTELEYSWRAAVTTIGGRRLRLDLSSVDNVDTAGKYLLALLHDRGVELIASGFVTTALVASIDEEWRRYDKA